MTSLDHALALAAAGFWVFPLELSTKKPRWKGWQVDASNDPGWIEKQWARDANVGIGILCGKFGPLGDGHLFLVDVDLKRGAAPATWLAGTTDGGLLPPTYTQCTPSGGLHLFYLSSVPVRSSHSDLAEGIDIHGDGYLAVGAGTTTAAGTYVADLSVAPVPAPAALIALCGEKKVKPPREASGVPAAHVNVPAALERGVKFLNQLDVAPDGKRNPLAYQAACHLRQLGVPDDQTFELLTALFKSEPPMEEAELWDVTTKAYRHAQGEYGELAPERIFHAPVQAAAASEVVSTGNRTPVHIFNTRFALVRAGGTVRIYDESPGADGNPGMEPMDLTSFRAFVANQRYFDGNGESQEMAKVWLTSPERRTYEGIVFHPGPDEAPAKFYNVWRGFTNGFHGEPTQAAHDFLGYMVENSLVDFCCNDKGLHRLHMGWYAHMVQFPWVKPQTAHVYQGKKGIGKDFFVDAMGALLPAHYMNSPKKRNVAGQFNAHLQNLLLFAANEAFWGGDLEIQGVLQDLITGRTLDIERKGCEQYKVKNLIRVVIMGNADKLVHTTADERRYQIYTVGERQRGAWKKFEDMRIGMAQGGLKLLLGYLRAFDLTGYSTNEVPNTQGLIDHKRSNLSPVHEWVMECLDQERIIGGHFAPEWPTVIDREPMRRACVTWCQEQGRLKYAPSSQLFGIRLREVLGNIDHPRRCEGRQQINVYKLPGLEEARDKFKEFLGEKKKGA